MGVNISSSGGGFLLADITSTDTTFQLTAGSLQGLTAPFFMTIYEGSTSNAVGQHVPRENIKVLAIAPNDVISSCERGIDAGIDGTPAGNWAAGTQILPTVSAPLLRSFMQSDSVIDADTLDGHDSTYFLNTGSVIDADTLDGLNSTDFALVGSIPAVSGQAKKLVISTGGASSGVNISYDELIVKNGNASALISGSVLVCNTAAVGLGGLDAGVLSANQHYGIYVIFNPVANTVSSLISLSLTAPTLPTGYTHFALVGRIKTDGTANKYPLGFLQHGKKVQPRVIIGSNTPNLPVACSGVTGTWDLLTPTYATVSLADILPPDAIAVSGTLVGSTDETGVMSSYVVVAPNNQYSGLQSTNPPPVSNVLWISATWGAQYVTINTPFTFGLESLSISVVIATSAGAVRILGWELP